MSKQTPILQPKLIESVQYDRAIRTYKFRLGEGTFDLDLDSDMLADVVGEILADLRIGELSTANLAKCYDQKLGPHSITLLLDLLVEQNVITEASPPPLKKRGAALFHEVKSHYQTVLIPTFSKEEGVLKLHEGRMNSADLKAWAVEYYFTTRFAEQCIIAAVNQHTNPELRRIFEEFFIGEVGHDKLLERSLLGFGYKESELDSLTPHISTVAAMGLLLRSSIYDIPFFITLVGQMEGSEQQSRDYIRVLERSGLPPEAIQPQITHEMINIEQDHFGEALQMASVLDSVSVSDIDRCKRLIALHIEMRRSVYSHVFPGVSSSGEVSSDLLKNAWLDYGRHIRKAVLSIAVANAPEADSRRFAREFVELRKVGTIDWDPTQKVQVAAGMLEYSLWKLSYQEPERLNSTLRWLDATAVGDVFPVEKVPRHFVNAMAAKEPLAQVA